MGRAVAIAVMSLAAVLAPASARAQSDPPRGGAAAIVGAGKSWDDEGSLGRGAGGGARVSWRLFGTTGVEGAVDHLTHNRRTGFFRAEGGSTIFSVSLVHRFGRARVQPYVLEGVHLLRHSGTVWFDGRRFDNDSTNPGFHFGGGFAVRVSDRIEVGPEARFHLVRIESGSDAAWAQWVGVRVGWRF